MCQRNWRLYNESLIPRGSLTFFCHPNLLKLIKKARKTDRKTGGRPAYSNQLLLILILLKISYRLTYRKCEGMARFLFASSSIPIPSYSTICRGIRRLKDFLPKLSERRSKICLIDSSGFKIAGEGEWKTKVHGKSYHRRWLKVHIVVDANSDEIVDLMVAGPDRSDIGLNFLDRLSHKTGIVFADGAYDGIRFRQKAYSRGIKALTPPSSNAQIKDIACLEERNDALRIIRGLGENRFARNLWGKLTGYCCRVKAENAFSRLKRLYGTRVFSRNTAAQFVEMWLKGVLSNIWLNWAQS